MQRRRPVVTRTTIDRRRVPGATTGAFGVAALGTLPMPASSATRTVEPG